MDSLHIWQEFLIIHASLQASTCTKNPRCSELTVYLFKQNRKKHQVEIDNHGTYKDSYSPKIQENIQIKVMENQGGLLDLIDWEMHASITINKKEQKPLVGVREKYK